MEENKSKKKTLIIVIVALVAIIAVVGIILLVTKVFGVSDEERQAAMSTAGKEYYEKYMSGVIGLTEAEITYDMLQKVVDEYDEEYDLEALKKCDADTKIIFTLEDGTIANEKVELNCK